MNSLDPLLMRCSLEALRCKLSTPNSPLTPWWRHFLTLARQDDWFGPYTVLAALVTGEEVDRERARAAFMRLVELGPAAYGSNEAQLHTHVTAAPIGRWAIFYDWVSDLELFTPAEDEAIRAALLDHAFVFPLQGLQARIRSFDNQILANAFSAAAVGYVLGVRRGESALGRRLFNTGLGWLLELLKRLPEGGYSGEGSTYQEHVVLPLVLLAALLVEETTGIAALQDGVAPGPPALEVLRFTHRLIGPAGLLPAWDDYGYQAATVKSPLAFLARATGDPTPLATIRQHAMWYRLTLPAWEADDRLWTLVWWPSELDKGQAERAYRPWLAPEAAGALQNGGLNTRLFQYWDVCGGLLQASRLQTDPNAITFEAFGSPLLVDGHGRLPKALRPLPAAARAYVGQRRLETIKEYRGATMSDEEALDLALRGGVGLSNALVLDGEDWYVPEQPCVGRGEALHALGALQAVRSDATAFYAGRYDVQSVVRTSVLVHGHYVLVCDRVQSATPHSVTWQAFVREATRVEDDRVVIHTPEQVRCDLIPLQEGALELVEVEGYPASVVRRSVRVRHTPPAAATARLDVALLPQHGCTGGQGLTDGWQRKIGDIVDEVSLATAYLNDPATAPEQPRRFRRRFYAKPQPQRKYFVVVQLAGAALEVWLNGQRIEPTLQQERGVWHESATHLPQRYDVTEALRCGENEISLVAPFFHGETVAGTVLLVVECAPLPVAARRTGEDTFAVAIDDATDDLVVERDDLVIERLANAPWLNGETDARYALRDADGNITALQVSNLRLPDAVELHSQPACDVVLTEETVVLSGLVIGTRLEIARPQGRLHLEYGGCLEVTCRGDWPRRIEVPWPHRGPIIVNGRVVSTPERRDGALVIVFPPGSHEDSTAPRSVEDIYALVAALSVEAAPTLIETLRADDWRLQIAAADAVGRLGLVEAVPALLELFAKSEAELPYPALTKWWSWSKMLHDAKDNGVDPDLPELGVKRWRVKRAVVTALGLLGDRRAVAPLEAALARCDDFFPVTSQLAVALGRLGAPSSVAVLERHVDHAEVNTRVHARLALQLLRGEIDRATFEGRVGLS
jgi:hypothetical protein